MNLDKPNGNEETPELNKATGGDIYMPGSVGSSGLPFLLGATGKQIETKFISVLMPILVFLAAACLIIQNILRGAMADSVSLTYSDDKFLITVGENYNAFMAAYAPFSVASSALLLGSVIFIVIRNRRERFWSLMTRLGALVLYMIVLMSSPNTSGIIMDNAKVDDVSYSEVTAVKDYVVGSIMSTIGDTETQSVQEFNDEDRNPTGGIFSDPPEGIDLKYTLVEKGKLFSVEVLNPGK